MVRPRAAEVGPLPCAIFQGTGAAARGRSQLAAAGARTNCHALVCRARRRTEQRRRIKAVSGRDTHKGQGAKVMAKHAPRFLNIVNDAKSRIRELNVNDVKQKLERGE